jgi:preprotein translocase subunit SecE
MASVTKSNQGNDAMADEESSEDVRAQDAESKVVEYRSPTTKSGRKGGFFTIYKKGQGYWTRMGTSIAAILIAFLFAQFVYSQMRATPVGKTLSGDPTYLATSVCVGVAVGVLVVLMFIFWRLMNKPSNVDFLIATDSEMKKVNWTTRKELIGSTKVVIIFVVLIAIFLFLLDVLFGYFFHLIKVLEFGPFE